MSSPRDSSTFMPPTQHSARLSALHAGLSYHALRALSSAACSPPYRQNQAISVGHPSNVVIRNKEAGPSTRTRTVQRVLAQDDTAKADPSPDARARDDNYWEVICLPRGTFRPLCPKPSTPRA